MVKTKYFRNIFRALQHFRVLVCAGERPRVRSQRELTHTTKRTTQCCHRFFFFCGTLFFVKMVIKLWLCFCTVCNAFALSLSRSLSLSSVPSCEGEVCFDCVGKSRHLFAWVRVCRKRRAVKQCVSEFVLRNGMFAFVWKFCSIKNQIENFVCLLLRW